MDIKLEIQSLVDIGNNMVNCCNSLNEVYESLSEIHIDSWQGNARTAFDEVMGSLRDRSSASISRLSASIIVLEKALQKYHAIEIGTAKANTSLPAEDIF